MADPNWRAKARCAKPDVDPDIFFSTEKHEIRAAKKICDDCKVTTECSAYYREHRRILQVGIWGGIERGVTYERDENVSA